MLEPRQADVPALFFFLVVLPVVVYILLGKWGEASRRKDKISFLVEEAAVESFGTEAMATASVAPLVPSPAAAFVPSPAAAFVPPPTAAIRECARCHGPATTRCSRCKSVRYCSGKCQIIHWRQGHKEECQPPENNSSLMSTSTEEADLGRNFYHEGPHPQFMDCPTQQPVQDRVQCDVESSFVDPGASCSTASASIDGSRISKPERRISERRSLRKSTKEMLDSNDRAATISNDRNLRSTANLSKETYTGDKQSQGVKYQNGDSLCSTKSCMNADEIGTDYPVPDMDCLRDGSNCSEEVLKQNSFPTMIRSNGSTGSKSKSNAECVKLAKSPKSMSKVAREQIHSAKVRKGRGLDESVNGVSNLTSAHGSNGTTSIGLKLMGQKKSSKISRHDASEMGIDGSKKVKVLFPYEELANFFEREVFDLVPRGLLNCGNSCYANAVLQCLTCTKPLVMFLLSRTHSKACCLKNWCLMCELEQHIMMLKEAGGPLSPSRILSHIRRINCQIGDGSQEDAHEFLRLLVASMQSICLEEVGSENQVHPTLQETTFVQQTFGGRLRSMVKCLRCHHESERYENIMDLTLEIFGWVESLEDALTQFTTPEDLDGENMYRCGRCASYVRARKQLSIDEAPNVLTIVLKRFQEGSYGKINKCITFPEMLDMIPFMTGTNDIPPLYMLYGVVVHVDTLNASFSGHYVSYVKDLQGNWFRIDDSVVQPVHMSQVMSEGAYILFYMRSYPRPPRGYIRKATRQLTAKSSRHCGSKAHNSSEIGRSIHRANNRFTPAMERYAELNGLEFSDATSSDWSLFTSSDEASFTSESTRDSFSTADYSDTCNINPFSSKLNTCCRECPSQRTISCRMFSGSKPVTRYISEQKGYILESDHLVNSFDDIHIGGNTRQVSSPFNEALLSDSGYQNFVNYESSPGDDFVRTCGNC